MKKIAAILTALVLMVTLLTSCSTDELGFYNTAKEITALKSYNYSGTLALNVNSLSFTDASGAGTEDTKTAEELIETMLKDAKVTFSGSVDTAAKTYSENISFSNSAITGLTVNLIVNQSDSTLCVTKSIADEFLPTDISYTTITAGGITFAKYNISDLIAAAEQSELGDIPDPSDNPYADKGEDASAGYLDGYYEGYGQQQSGSEKDPLTDIDVPDGVTDAAAYKQAYVQGYNDGWTDGSNKPVSKGNDILTAALPLLTALDTPANTDLSTKLQALGDNLVNNYFSGLQTGLISKTGDSRYSADLNATSVASALKKTVDYIIANPAGLKSALTTFVNGLNDSELSSLFFGEPKSDILKEIDEMDFSGVDTSVFNTLAEEINKEFSADLKLTVTKTGDVSYEEDATVSMKTAADSDLGFSLDATGSCSVAINPDKAEDIGVTASNFSYNEGSATLNLGVTAQDCASCGVLLSTDKTLAGASQVKMNGSTVTLTGLSPHTVYYYAPYLIDSAGNLLQSGTVLSFTTPDAAPVSSSVPSSSAPVSSSTPTSAPVSSAVSVSSAAVSSVSVSSAAQADSSVESLPTQTASSSENTPVSASSSANPYTGGGNPVSAYASVAVLACMAAVAAAAGKKSAAKK